jgi:zinc finger protein
MSKDDSTASAGVSEKKDQIESQFHKLGEIVEKEDDTGLVEIESLCMNCHENVRSTG